MKKSLTGIVAFAIFWSTVSVAKVLVLPVGVFHFSFPNKDVVEITEADQIDVLKPPYDQQVKSLSQVLAGFNPDYVVVEFPFSKQAELAAQYEAYRNGQALDKRSEVYQLGFRVAGLAGLKTVYGVDTWGALYDDTQSALQNEQTAKAFETYYLNPPDANLKFDTGKPVYKQAGIAGELLRINEPEYLKQSLGNYLIGHFNYHSAEHPYFGADFESGRWFNRNLRILQNIQRLPLQDESRVLVIYGAGHLNLLNHWFDASPQFTLVSPLPFLERAAQDVK